MAEPLRRPLAALDLTPLLSAGHVEALDRALLEVAWRSSLSPAVALWRKLDSPDPARREDWRLLVARGPLELLPAEPLVRAALLGAIDARLPGGATVVSACIGARCVALVLSAAPSEEAEDLAAALVELHAALGPALTPAAHPFQPPLPTPRRDTGPSTESGT